MTSTTRTSLIRRGIAVTAAVAIGAALTAAPALAATGHPTISQPTADQPTISQLTTGQLTAGQLGTERPSIALPASARHRGELVSATPIRQLNRTQVIAELTEAGFDPAAARHGVTLYRLIYRTIDAHGRPTTASGLLVLPHTSKHKLTTVSYAHGTELFRGDAPSVTTDTWSTAPPITYAAAGFAAVAPDYLGLGLGPGRHPWMHVPSEVTASVDLLRAARTFTTRTGSSLGQDVLVTGFSQGASAALGTARALQDGRVPGFRLSALAPVSGGYDFRRSEIPAVLSGRLDGKISAVYLADLFVSWNRLHGLYATPSDVFRAPYDRTVTDLFDGDHPGEQVVGGLPNSVDRLFTPRALAMLRHPSGRFADALRVADSTCTGWTPQVPIRLYATTTDEQAVFKNSLACQASFAKSGLHVPIVDVGKTDHLDSNIRATAAIARWFRSLSDHTTG